MPGLGAEPTHAATQPHRFSPQQLLWQAQHESPELEPSGGSFAHYNPTPAYHPGSTAAGMAHQPQQGPAPFSRATSMPSTHPGLAAASQLLLARRLSRQQAQLRRMRAEQQEWCEAAQELLRRGGRQQQAAPGIHAGSCLPHGPTMRLAGRGGAHTRAPSSGGQHAQRRKRPAPASLLPLEPRQLGADQSWGGSPQPPPHPTSASLPPHAQPDERQAGGGASSELLHVFSCLHAELAEGAGQAQARQLVQQDPAAACCTWLAPHQSSGGAWQAAEPRGSPGQLRPPTQPELHTSPPAAWERPHPGQPAWQADEPLLQEAWRTASPGSSLAVQQQPRVLAMSALGIGGLPAIPQALACGDPLRSPRLHPSLQSFPSLDALPFASQELFEAVLGAELDGSGESTPLSALLRGLPTPGGSAAGDPAQGLLLDGSFTRRHTL